MRGGPQETQAQSEIKKSVYNLFDSILALSPEDRFLQQPLLAEKLRDLLTKGIKSDGKISLRDKVYVGEGINLYLNPLQIAALFGLNDLVKELLSYNTVEVSEFKMDSSLLGIDDADSLGNTAMHYVALRLAENTSDPSIWALLSEMQDEKRERLLVSNHGGETVESLIKQPFLARMPDESELETIDFSESVPEPGKILTRLQQAFDGQTLHSEEIHQIVQEFNSQNSKDETPLPGPPPLKYLALQGGGVKGTAYPGAAKVLTELGLLDNIDTFAGASAGAISSALLMLGYDGDQFRKISTQLNFQDFNDLNPEGWGTYFGGYGIGIIMDLKRYGAAYSGITAYQWISAQLELITGNPNITFKEFHELRQKDPTLKDAIFKATRYRGTGDKEQTFSHIHTPDIRIADAVRASMSFPGAFAPWPVRDNLGNIFGVFADGGILNNYPIDVFNSQKFYDLQYTPIERLDHAGKPHQINPCSAGLSLTPLEELKEEITPFTPRLKELTAKVSSPTSSGSVRTVLSPEQEAAEKEAWGFMDLATGIWWNQVGIALREDMLEKHKLYQNQTVQIYPEEIGTLEFDLSSKKLKLQRLESSAANAMRLWLTKFRDPFVPYTQEYQEAPLTQQEQKLKKTNPLEFYKVHLTKYFLEFYKEIELMSRQGYVTNEELLKNVQLGYLSFHINNTMKSINKHAPHASGQIIESAMKEALQQYKDRVDAIKEQRIKRDRLIDESSKANLIADKISQGKYDEVIRLMQGQLSAIIPLMNTTIAATGTNLLGFIVQHGDAEFTKRAFNVFSDVVKLCSLQGRTDELRFTLETMLNEFASPPVFTTLALFDTDQQLKMLDAVLQYGGNPLLINPKTKLNGIQEMIREGKFDAFKKLVEHCYAKDSYFASGLFNNESLGHYALNNASHEFLEKLYIDPALRTKFFDYNAVDKNNNTIVELGARLANNNPQDLRWHLVARPSDNFEKTTKSALEKFQQAESDRTEAIANTETLFTSDNYKDFIKTLSAKQCFNILMQPKFFDNQALNQLCALSQQPDKSELLLLLCEKCQKDSAIQKQFLASLNQKYDGKTPLYFAATAGNVHIVHYLRGQYLEVDNSGPIEASSALLIAAQKGHSDTVSIMLKTQPTQYFAYRRGFAPITLGVRDISGKNALHYLAKTGTPEAFCDLLYSGAYPNQMAIEQDQDGKTPLFYLVENNRLDILKMIFEKGKGKGKRSRTIQRHDYYFDDLFIPVNQDLSDFIYAKRTNPQVYEFLCEHLSRYPKKASEIIEKIESSFSEHVKVEQQQIKERTQNMISIKQEENNPAEKYDVQLPPLTSTTRASYTPHNTKIRERDQEKEREDRTPEPSPLSSSKPRRGIE